LSVDDLASVGNKTELVANDVRDGMPSGPVLLPSFDVETYSLGVGEQPSPKGTKSTGINLAVPTEVLVGDLPDPQPTVVLDEGAIHVASDDANLVLDGSNGEGCWPEVVNSVGGVATRRRRF